MKQFYFLFFSFILVFCQLTFSQNITVSANTFSDQQLIEDILFGTNCVDDINVTNTVTGNFSNGDLSYGYFNANNSDFPFSEGLVLSTGRLSNVPGPNDNLSDDDAPNWGGDQDLNNAIGINNTLNATVFEFSFVPQANNISFRYLFASEEYRENNPFTCDFSDAFAFLIRPVGGQYQNLALVPGTNTPVLVTTVRPEIPGECEAVNEEFFGQFNGINSPINFNGQTAILTAEADITAGQIYEIKLVIADETNYRYDSAVFIEGNSFNVGVDLGQNQTLCTGETTALEIDNADALAIRWFYEGQLINDADATINVSQDDFGSGLYTVEVDLPSGCTAEDEVEIFFDQINLPDQLTISTCLDEDGFGVFNLLNVSSQIDNNLQIIGFYNTLADAENTVNPISNPASYGNVVSDEIVFVRLLSPGNCTAVQEVFLFGAEIDLEETIVTVCPAMETSPTSFALQSILVQVAENFIVQPQNVDLFYTESDAIAQINEISSGFLEIETDLLPITVYARMDAEDSCLGIAPVILQKIEGPQFLEDKVDYLICDNTESSVTLSATIENPQGEIFYDWENGQTTETITISEPGTYRVDVTSIQLIDNQEVICSSFRIFTVLGSSLPDVSYTQSGFAGTGSNQLLIKAEGSGHYEYALNNSGFVDSNVFNVENTENTFRVRDKNGCGEVIVNFIALSIPDFFTPNGDGFNDYWQIKGIRQAENDVKTIYIFDRYGKLIFESSPELIGWDGNYNGIPMPGQDYWYKIVLNSGRSFSGHLTLKR